MTSVAAIGGQMGAIMAALIAAWIIPTAGWHMLFLVGIIPVILTIFIRKHVHESQQFVEAKEKERGSLLSDVAKMMFSTPRLAWQNRWVDDHDDSSNCGLLWFDELATNNRSKTT